MVNLNAHLEPMDIVFDLHVPASANASGLAQKYNFVFPFAPSVYQAPEPYTFTAAAGLDGGLITHVNGVTGRPITIAGSFGWSPKTMRSTYGSDRLAATAVDIESANFQAIAKRSDEVNFTSENLVSGQLQLQFLQDKIFRAYSEMKRDPLMATGAKLVLHNLKLDEHWQIEPLSFNILAAVPQSMTVQYQIQMLAVAPAARGPNIFSMSLNGGILSRISQAAASIKRLVASVRSSIVALKSFVDSAVRTIVDGINAVKSLGDIITSAVSFVENVVSSVEGALVAVEGLIKAPAAIVNGIADAADKLAEMITFTSLIPRRIQATYEASVRRAARSVARLGAALKTSSSEILSGNAASFRSGLMASTGSDARALTVTGGDTIGASVKAMAEGGRVLAESQAQSALRRVPRKAHAYTSVLVTSVSADDTLQRLATRFIGDTAAWVDIASLNALSPPFISSLGIPGTLQPGAQILIPTTSTLRGSDLGGRGLIGNGAATDPGARAYGTDLAANFVQVGNSVQMDVKLNGTQTDFASISGVDLVDQAIRVRRTQDINSDILTPNMGCTFSVGSAAGPSTLRLLEHNITEFLLQDPRISGVRSLQVRIDGDAIFFTADLQLKSGETFTFTS